MQILLKQRRRVATLTFAAIFSLAILANVFGVPNAVSASVSTAVEAAASGAIALVLGPQEFVSKTGVAGATPTGGTGSTNISWTINYGLTTNSTSPLANVGLSDQWNAGQTLVPGSLKTPGGLWASSQPDGTSLSFNNPLVPADAKGVTQAFPKPVGTGVTFVGSGDGYNPAITASGKIMGVNHHINPSFIWCYDMKTGASCPGYKKSLPVATGYSPTTIAIGNKIYFSDDSSNTNFGQTGHIYCWDSDTNAACGQSPQVFAVGLARVDTKLFTQTTAGALDCFDTANNLNRCSGFTAVPFGIAPGNTLSFSSPNASGGDLFAVGSKVYIAGWQRKLACFDAAANTACTGFPALPGVIATTATGNSRSNIFPRLSGNGAVTGICVAGQTTDATCYNLDASSPVNVTMSATHHVYTAISGNVDTYVGSRVFFANYGAVDKISCWDWAAVAPCTGSGFDASGYTTAAVAPRTYGMTNDGVNVFSFGDAGILNSWDTRNGTTPATRVATTASVNIDDYYCGTPDAVPARWDKITLSDVNLTSGVEFTSLKVSLKDPSTGGTVFGPVEAIGTTGVFDVSTVPGTYRTLQLVADETPVGTVAWNDNIAPKVSLMFASDAPVQFCYQTVVSCNGTASTFTDTISTMLDPHSAVADVTACSLSPNLGVVKSAPSPSLKPGQISTYNITVTNNGSASATAASVKEGLPAGLDLVSIGSLEWSCNTASKQSPVGTVSCAYTGGALAPGASSSFSVQVQPRAAYAGNTVINYVSVDPTSGANAPNPTNCTGLNAPTAGCGAPVSSTVGSAPPNAAPNAYSQAVSTNQNTPVAISLSASDTDNNFLFYSIKSAPSNGALTGSGQNLTYTPANGFAGMDSFTFVANDGFVDSAPATVTIAVVSPKTQAVATALTGGGVYTGIPYLAPASCSNNLGPVITYSGGNAPIDVGTTTYTVTCGDGGVNYFDATASGSIVITKAPSTTTVSCPPSAIYTGAAITPCTAVVAGAGGLAGSVTPVTYANNTNVGTATASASYTGDANHAASTGSASFTIDAVCSAPASGLVAWYQGENSPLDIVGNVTGQATGPSLYTTGKVGQAFDLNGSNYFSIPSTNVPVGNAARSMDFWVKVRNATPDHEILVYGAFATHQAFGIDVDGTTPAGNVKLQIFTYADDINGMDTGVPLNQFMHVAVTYDGNRALKAYVNGVLKQTTTLYGPLDTKPSAVTIGHFFGNFNGLLDEAKIYNRALTAQEVNSIYNAGSLGTCPPPVTSTTVATQAVPYSMSPQNVVLGAAVTSPAGVVNSGNVKFTVATQNGTQVGSEVSGSVSGGSASAAYTLPAGTTVQDLKVKASFTNADSLAYQSSLGEGVLAVQSIQATATATDGGGVYSGSAYLGSGECSNGLTPSITYGGGSAPVNAGTSSFTVTCGDGGVNYVTGTATGSIVITKAAVIAKAGSGSSVYDGAAHPPSMCTVSGVYTGGLTCANDPSTSGPNVGTTTISPVTSGTDLANFIVTPVEGSYSISPASSMVTVTCPTEDQPYTGVAQTPCSATFTTSDGLSASLGVSYSGNIDVGTVTASASYAGDPNRTGNSNEATFRITKAKTTVAVVAEDAIFDGLQHGGTANATGVNDLNETLIVTYIGRGTTVYGPTTDAPTNAGDYTASASYSGTDNYTDGAAQKDFAILKAASTTTVTCTGGPFTYSGSAFKPCSAIVDGVGLGLPAEVNYTDNVNTGTAVAFASFDGDANHTGSSDSETFSIGKANQTITFGALNATTFGAADFTIEAMSTSGLPVSLTVTGGTCTVSPGTSPSTVHITGAGNCSITASQAGNGNFNAATDVPRSFSIAKAAQVINFAPLGNVTYGAADFLVSATGGASSNPVTFAATGNCAVSGNTITITGAGSCTVTASQAGNGNYDPAADVSRSFNIAKAVSAITVSAAVYAANGGSYTISGVLTGVANAPLNGQTVTFSIGTQSCNATTNAVGAASCTINGVNQQTGPGLVVTSAFTGNSNYLGSGASTQTFVYSYAAANGGAFIIGDRNAAVGSNVTYWGAQWTSLNGLSGGAAPAAFKGFANRSSTTPASVGATWTTDPGNSSNPPATVPAYMAVIVTSTATKSGSTISGNTTKVVIVRTNTGYAADPGKAGTGTVVAFLP